MRSNLWATANVVLLAGETPFYGIISPRFVCKSQYFEVLGWENAWKIMGSRNEGKGCGVGDENNE